MPFGTGESVHTYEALHMHLDERGVSCSVHPIFSEYSDFGS